MRTGTCDQCGATAPSQDRFNTPEGWMTVEQGQEDPLDFCTIHCLATWATLYSIESSNP